MMGGMRILRALGIAAVLTLIPASASAIGVTTGGADPDSTWTGRSMQHYDAQYYLNADGTVDVSIDFVFDFGDNWGHGPEFSYPTRVGYDTSNDRFFPVSNIRASSPTAPANVYIEQGKYWVDIRIGDENIGDVHGAHQYHLEYTVDALMNATYGSELADWTGDPEEQVYDELYLDVIGRYWRVPFHDVTITIGGDAPALDGGCSSGAYGDFDACDSFRVSPDGAVVATEDYIAPYEPMTIGAWYPPGSYDTEPIIRNKNDLAYALSFNRYTGTGAAVVLGAGVLLLTRRLRSHAVDEQYAGLTPGVGPTDVSSANIVKRDYDAPVAVAFEPPPGMLPGELGTLIDEKADKRDVTATIIDLAVRGYMVIEEYDKGTKKKKKDMSYKLIKKREADGALVEYERTLLDGIFKSGAEVELDDLKTTFLATMQSAQKQMYKDVTNKGWFRGNPQSARGAWVGAGIGLLIAGVVLTWFVGTAGPWALVPLPIALIGIMVIVTTRNAPARTAEGTKVLAQTKGFELFLETADANQIKWEEGRDIFSRYLPYAIAFDVADKWADTFAKLAKSGATLPEPNWYNGVVYGSLWHSTGRIGSLSDRISSFTSMADAAISAPTPGSSGGSFGSSGGGFSGGGFSGGGSFGGGGGGW